MKARGRLLVFFASSLAPGFAGPAFAQNFPVTSGLSNPPALLPNGTPAGAAPGAGAKDAEAIEVPGPEPTPGEAKLKASLKTFSGVVNVLRQDERVEAVFKSGDVFQLPRGSKQHVIFKALQDSERTGSAVSITYDQRSNVIQSVGSGSSGGGSADKVK